MCKRNTPDKNEAITGCVRETPEIKKIKKEKNERKQTNKKRKKNKKKTAWNL